MGDKSCCLKGFAWDGKPTGTETKLAGLNCYTSGSNPNAAVLVISDLFGWTFTNLRLLCDHYASEANATVYMPDL
jgi:dienelactone hydrolase